MKKIYWILLILLITGCQNTSGNKSYSKINELPKNCPENPGILTSSKDVSLKHTPTQEKVTLGKDQSIGYKFNGERDKTISYEFGDKENICIWIQTPDNKIFKTSELKITTPGKYLVQISALEKKELDMKMRLMLPSPREFVINYYQKLQKRQYEEAWKNLSDEWKRTHGENNTPYSYTEYATWWNGVNEIRIGTINEVEIQDDRAIVDAELVYIKKDGRIIQDKTNYAKLIWNPVKNNWEISKKASNRN